MLLSSEQQLAVETKADKVLVAASAGSGKTTVITERLKYLLAQGADPKTIYAITYTNNAAQEMKNRVGNNEMFIGTIHGLANYILLTNGYDTSKYIEEEAFDRLLEIAKEEEINLPEVSYLLIDEFQDICDDEYEFCFSTLRPRSFFVVGDSRQAIYTFKGSNYEHFFNLAEHPAVTVYELSNCYRCAPEIIDFASTFLYGMHDIYETDVKCDENKTGEVHFLAYDPSEMVDIIENSWDSYKEWFIICRTNSEVNDLVYYLQKRKIPCDTFKKADLTLEELQAKQEENTVKILTIHSAKGLESKNVMVVGARKFNPEERRICYVAATRAEEQLYWISAPKKQKPTKTMVKW